MARDVSDDTKQTVGEILKRLRQENLWSQVDLARRIRTTPVSVGRWENNITRPSLHFQQQLCELFAKSPAELGFLAQPEPDQGEDSPYTNQPQQGESAQRVSGSLPSLIRVFPSQRQRTLLPRPGVVWRRKRLLMVLICLTFFLPLSTFFWFVRQFPPASATYSPSCQTPFPFESGAVIYAQVMCRPPLRSSALDQQDGLRWDENDRCRFQQGTYRVLLPATEDVAECFAHTGSFGPNFALQVDMTILKGYSGGLVFRAKGPSSNWDEIISRVSIDIWGQYSFFLAGNNAPCHLSKGSTDPNYCYSPAFTITYGPGASNTMTIIALGSQVFLYVNGFFLDHVRVPDSFPLTGFLGVFANGSGNGADVAFRHLQIWSI